MNTSADILRNTSAGMLANTSAGMLANTSADILAFGSGVGGFGLVAWRQAVGASTATSSLVRARYV